MTPLAADAAELDPGRIRNPVGLQANAAIAYNSVQDYYLVGYAGNGRAFVGKLDPVTEAFSGELAISPQVSANSMALSYNPVRNEFLYVWRNSSPNTIRARYLDGDGNPIGDQFAVGNGRKPQMDFDPVNQRYLVTFGQPGGKVIYRVIDGDSTNPNPILFQGTLASGNAIADRVKFGDVAGKFLVAYIRNESSDNIYGRFVTTTAGSVDFTNQFPIDNSAGTEQSPTLGYMSNENRWICAYQNWPGGGVLPNARVALINPSRAVTRRFNVAATTAWEIPSAVVYNATTQTVVFGWRHSGGGIENSRVREWQISDAAASPVGNVIMVSTDNAAITAATARPNVDDPQVTVLWRINNGGDGVYAGILHPTDPPPGPPPGPPPTSDPFDRTYRVTVENLSGGQAFSAPVVATHNSGVRFYRTGRAASAEMQALAENADNGPLTTALGADRRVSEVVTGVALVPGSDPGSTALGSSTNMELGAVRRDRYFSLVSKLMCTNDGFVGLGRIKLPSNGVKVYFPRVGDAGSELNTEDFADLVPECQTMIGVTSGDAGTTSSDPTLDEKGRIGRHDGILGGNDLVPTTHGWIDPIVRITVTTLRDDARRFQAKLEGEYVVVQDTDGNNTFIDTRGRGNLSLRVSRDGSSLRYNLTARRIADVTEAHIRAGLPDENGPIVATLVGASVPGVAKGKLAIGEIAESDLAGPFANDLAGFLTALANGELYMSIQTNLFPDGEVRGQIGAK